jgi:hypothetical protein
VAVASVVPAVSEGMLAGGTGETAGAGALALCDGVLAVTAGVGSTVADAADSFRERAGSRDGVVASAAGLS